jgi:putative membrane protein
VRSLFRFLLLWYAAWLVVGLGLAGYELFQGNFKYTKALFPTGHLEDLIFLALAAALLGLWLAARLGTAKTWALFAWITLSSGLVEWYGEQNDLPFGNYRYTDHLGPRLPGGLPLAVPLAWWVVIVPVYLSAQTILALIFPPRKKPAPNVENSGETTSSPWPAWLLAVATALGAVAMDLALEPAAGVRGYWFWDSSGGWWYAVPAQNFIGWAVVSLILALGLQALAGRPLRESFRPGGVPLLLPLLLPATVLAPFWIDLAGQPRAQVWLSLLLIFWLGQTMLWTGFRPALWPKVLWVGPPDDALATNPEMNRSDKS